MSDPRQLILPKSPQTVEIDGEEVPVLDVPIDGETRGPRPRRPRTRVERVRRPRQRRDVLIEWEGRWRTLEPDVLPRPQLGELPHRRRHARPPPPAHQHRHHRRPRHGRHGDLIGARRLRAVALPDPRREADHGVADRGDHPPPLRHDRAVVRRVPVPRVDRHVAAADRAALLRQRLQRVPAAPVLHDHPPRARRGGVDRRRRAAAHADGRSSSRRRARRSSPSPCSTSSSPGTTSSSRSSTCPARRRSTRSRSGCTASSACTSRSRRWSRPRR